VNPELVKRIRVEMAKRGLYRSTDLARAVESNSYGVYSMFSGQAPRRELRKKVGELLSIPESEMLANLPKCRMTNHSGPRITQEAVVMVRVEMAKRGMFKVIDLEAATGVPRQSLYHMLKPRGGSMNVIETVAEHLGLDPQALIDRSDSTSAATPEPESVLNAPSEAVGVPEEPEPVHDAGDAHAGRDQHGNHHQPVDQQTAVNQHVAEDCT